VRGFTLVLAALAAHPLHTTLTELSYRDADRSVEVSVRAFADDFRAAAGRDLTDSTAFAYLASALTLSDRAGHTLRLTWCGLRQTGDLLWLCLRAPAPEGLSGLRVNARLLFERYADQINIVQASYEGRRASLLFSRGDSSKQLPS
jgi:hypothetical protein